MTARVRERQLASDTRVRPATPADLPAIGRLAALLVRAQHGGMGSMLLNATITALEKRGAPRIVLSTAARNENAQRLFARTGFRPTMIEMTRECTTRSP